MLLSKRIVVCPTILMMCVMASAQTNAYTPEPGSIERKAIMDSLRLPLEKELKQKIVFKVDHLKVKDGWAFMRGVPQQPDGKKVNYKNTPYQEAINDGIFDDWICALLHKEGGKWKVTIYTLGATDVPYIGWDKEFNAPSSIFDSDK